MTQPPCQLHLPRILACQGQERGRYVPTLRLSPPVSFAGHTYRGLTGGRVFSLEDQVAHLAGRGKGMDTIAHNATNDAVDVDVDGSTLYIISRIFEAEN